MTIRNTIIALIFAFSGLAPVSGQYFTKLGIGLDVRATANIPITVADPCDAGFSGQLLASRYPGRKIPTDPIRLVYPSMPGAIDTAAILWYLRPEEISAVPGELNVILVAIMPDNAKRYFLDGNNDRVFSSSENSFVFKSTEKSKTVNIMIDGTYYPYTLLNPDYIPPPAPSETIGPGKSAWLSNSRRPSLAIDLSGSFFSGKTNLSYTRLSRPDVTITYFADIPGSFRPALGLDFSWYGAHLILHGSYETIEYTNNIIVSTEGDIHTTYYNRGTWPGSRIYASFSLEYDFSTGKYLFLTPYCSFSKFTNYSKYDFDTWQSDPEGAEYSDTRSSEYGIKLKLPATPATIVYINISYSSAYYNAERFFRDILPGSFRMHQDGFYYGIGCKLRLTGSRK